MTGFLKSSAFATAVAAGVASGALSAGPARAAGASPGILRIGYGQACARHAGTVAFVLENSDRHRHTVSISGKGLSPAADAGTVPAARTIVVQFGIGAKGTTVSVSVDKGAPRTQRLEGCPRGDGDQGLIRVHTKKAADSKPADGDADKGADKSWGGSRTLHPAVPRPDSGHDHAAAPERHHAAPHTPDHVPGSAPRPNPGHATSPRRGTDRQAPPERHDQRPDTLPGKRPTTPPPVNTA